MTETKKTKAEYEANDEVLGCECCERTESKLVAEMTDLEFAGWMAREAADEYGSVWSICSLCFLDDLTDRYLNPADYVEVDARRAAAAAKEKA